MLTKQAEEGTNNLISEFRDLPSRLQETLMPDLARLSQHSKAYLFAANAGITDGVRPILGGWWAAVAASATSVALLLPLFMLTACCCWRKRTSPSTSRRSRSPRPPQGWSRCA
jgi:hypothetical protein